MQIQCITKREIISPPDDHELTRSLEMIQNILTYWVSSPSLKSSLGECQRSPQSYFFPSLHDPFIFPTPLLYPFPLTSAPAPSWRNSTGSSSPRHFLWCSPEVLWHISLPQKKDLDFLILQNGASVAFLLLVLPTCEDAHRALFSGAWKWNTPASWDPNQNTDVEYESATSKTCFHECMVSG